MKIENIALIGFGEVGQTLAKDLISNGKRIYIYDSLLNDVNSIPSKAVANINVQKSNDYAEAIKYADIIISAVTADQTLNVALEIAKSNLSGQYYLDLNSASPSTKYDAASLINTAGGRYIEASIMSPIKPKNIASPIILGGKYAQSSECILQELGFIGARFYSSKNGKAAATKLCRSVMIKGLEALISESMLAAYHYGVEDEVLSSLNNLFPHPDWKNFAHYMITRTLEHGKRRSEEMSEAAKTVQEAGIEPIMSNAIAKRQALAPKYNKALKNKELDGLIREIRLIIQQEES